MTGHGAMMSSRLWIDDRYRGAHGIGRYAQEITSRLTLPWSPLGLDGAPAQPLDFLRRIPAHAREGVVYSPGYGALLSAKRQILTIHDLIHLQTDWPGRAKYLAYYNGVVRPVIRRNKVVLTVSETSRRAIQEWVDDDTVDVVNAGIGCSPAFTAEGPVFESERPYLLFVGNTRPHKNLATVLDALALVPDVDLRVVAPAAEVPEIREWGRRRGVEHRLVVQSGVDDIALAQLYRGARATLMPSILEGFGLPALESVMCGTPVIYWSGCAAVAEAVGASGTSTASPSDTAEWRSAIEERLRHAQNVEPPPSGSFDWKNTGKRVEALLAREASN